MNDIFDFFQGQPVSFDIDGKLKGTGIIVGAATTPLYGMGRMWIVKVDDGGIVPNEEYPFTTIIVNEPALTDLTDSVAALKRWGAKADDDVDICTADGQRRSAERLMKRKDYTQEEADHAVRERLETQKKAYPGKFSKAYAIREDTSIFSICGEKPAMLPGEGLYEVPYESDDDGCSAALKQWMKDCGILVNYESRQDGQLTFYVSPEQAEKVQEWIDRHRVICNQVNSWQARGVQ